MADQPRRPWEPLRPATPSPGHFGRLTKYSPLQAGWPCRHCEHPEPNRGHLVSSSASTARCRCGRPAPDAFLCTHCADELALDLEALNHYLPELTVVLTRQQRTTDNRTRQPARPETDLARALAVPVRKLTASESGVSLVATALQFDPAASALLTEARNTLSTWCRHLCETRGIPLDRILEAA